MTSSDDPAGHRSVLVVSGEAEVQRQFLNMAGSGTLPFLPTVVADPGSALSRLGAEADSPSVVVIDVDALDGHAAAVVRAVLRAAPSARVLTLSASHGRSHVMAMLSAGAAGCLVKGAGAGTFSEGIRAALRGELVLPFDLAVEVVGESSLRAIATQTRRTEIRDAVDGGSFQVAFQPVFRLEDITVAGVEALARFDAAPSRPDAWVAEAWALGLGLELELAILSRAIRSAARRPAGVFLAVNVSLLALVTDRFRQALSAVDDLQSMVVEVTRPLEPEDHESLIGPLSGLRSRGLRLAVPFEDSFELGDLQSLRPDMLELPISRAGDIEHDPAQRERLHDLVRSARDAGAALAAVGIETTTQLRVLMEAGVGYGQGYLLARPEPRLDLSRL